MKKDEDLPFDENGKLAADWKPNMSEGKTAILTKLNRIMASIDRIGKDARNDHGQYNYASEQAIKEALHPLLAKNGVVFTISTAAPIFQRGDDDKNGKQHLLQAVPVEYTFWDMETGQSISGTFIGSAHTRDDKGTYAAITGAIKYILTSTFLIPTGDDPEAEDEKPKRRATYTPPTDPESAAQSAVPQVDGCMPSKFGEPDKPSKCGICKEYHIKKGDIIVNFMLGDAKVWGHVECFERQWDTKVDISRFHK